MIWCIAHQILKLSGKVSFSPLTRQKKRNVLLIDSISLCLSASLFLYLSAFGLSMLCAFTGLRMERGTESDNIREVSKNRTLLFNDWKTLFGDTAWTSLLMSLHSNVSNRPDRFYFCRHFTNFKLCVFFFGGGVGGWGAGV